MTSRPHCSCCKTGAEYIRKHIDCVTRVPLGVDPEVLAVAAIEHLEEGYAPSYVPDRHTMAAWLREAQAARQIAVVGAA